MNIFEYFKKKGIDTIDSSFYSKIAMWDSWYRANVKRFHQYRVYHGTGQYERCHRKSLGMAKKICEDISDLLLNERVTIRTRPRPSSSAAFSMLRTSPCRATSTRSARLLAAPWPMSRI